MIIEILLGIIFLVLTFIGIGMVDLKKKLSKGVNFNEAGKRIEGLRSLISRLYKTVDNIPTTYIANVSQGIGREALKVDAGLEKYNQEIVRTSQNAEFFKLYMNKILSIIKWYGHKMPENALKGYVRKYLSNLYEITGEPKVKQYKLKPQAQA